MKSAVTPTTVPVPSSEVGQEMEKSDTDRDCLNSTLQGGSARTEICPSVHSGLHMERVGPEIRFGWQSQVPACESGNSRDGAWPGSWPEFWTHSATHQLCVDEHSKKGKDAGLGVRRPARLGSPVSRLSGH